MVSRVTSKDTPLARWKRRNQNVRKVTEPENVVNLVVLFEYSPIFTRVVVQRITGKEGSFHTAQMIAYGTKSVNSSEAASIERNTLACLVASFQTQFRFSVSIFRQSYVCRSNRAILCIN